jgi:hypothetical protein
MHAKAWTRQDLGNHELKQQQINTDVNTWITSTNIYVIYIRKEAPYKLSYKTKKLKGGDPLTMDHFDDIDNEFKKIIWKEFKIKFFINMFFYL